MTFADRIAEQATSERVQNVARIRRQAEERARITGVDMASAANEAERLWHPGCSHEVVIAEAAGAFRRSS